MSEQPQWIRDLIIDARTAYIEFLISRDPVSGTYDTTLLQRFNELAQKVADALDTTTDQARNTILCLN